LFSTLIIRNVSNHNIKAISEGSCDTEDKKKKSALITGINDTLLYIHS